MAESVSEEVPGAPPPPPPPLPTSPRGTSTHPAGDLPSVSVSAAGLSSVDCSSTSQGKTRELNMLTDELQRIISAERLEQACMLISRQELLISILQDGPMCGLVALAMCSQMLRKDLVSTDLLFNYARQKGFTVQGEMFSAANMLDLAEQVMNCRGRVLDVSTQGSLRLLITHVIGGNPLLFPYDADANHSPCLKGGHKAHWAAVSGLLIIAEQSPDLVTVLRPDQYLAGLYHIRSTDDFIKDTNEKDLSQYHQTLNSIIDIAEQNVNLVYLYCKQGKSKFTRLYSLGKLIESNRNLREIDPKIMQNIQDYIMPECGIEGICGKVVLLEKSSV